VLHIVHSKLKLCANKPKFSLFAQFTHNFAQIMITFARALPAMPATFRNSAWGSKLKSLAPFTLRLASWAFLTAEKSTKPLLRPAWRLLLISCKVQTAGQVTTSVQCTEAGLNSRINAPSKVCALQCPECARVSRTPARFVVLVFNNCIYRNISKSNLIYS
jgi:hypothetical protein